MNWVWGLPLSSNEKIVLLAIADCANDEGFAYPGYNTLTRKTGMARSTLAKKLKLLSASGLLEKSSHAEIGRGRKVNTYTISMRGELTESMRVELIENIKVLRKDISRPISPILELRKVQSSNSISPTLEHETSLEPSVIQTPVSRYPEGLNIVAWEKYKKYRRQARLKALTKMSEDEQVRALIGYGDYSIQEACINKTISSGWGSIYPPAQNDGRNNHATGKRSSAQILAEGCTGEAYEQT